MSNENKQMQLHTAITEIELQSVLSVITCYKQKAGEIKVHQVPPAHETHKLDSHGAFKS